MAEAPNKFFRSESDIIMKGLLSVISLDTSEAEIHREMYELMRSCSYYDFGNVTEKDFQFIDMSGKVASVAQYKEGFECNGRALKKLAGAGCVYIRLTKNKF